MPQLSLYLDEPTMEMLREKSSRAHQSMSRYVTGLIRESGEGRGWPSGYWEDVYKRQGVGSTDAGVGMATGKAWFKVPETIKFVIDGELAPGVTGKDVILHIIGMIGVDGALYKAMEFTGSAIESMPMDERLSISNMAIEAGGKAGLIPVDDVTRAYLDAVSYTHLDVYKRQTMNDTALYADILLPACHWFETEDLRVRYYCNPYLLWNEKAVEPLYESKPDFEIYKLIAEAMGYGDFFQFTADEYLNVLLSTPYRCV